jgi:hypothetical protein
MAHRDLLLHGSGAHEDIVPLLLSSHIPAQRITDDCLRTCSSLVGIRACLYAHLCLQLYADILHLGELGWRTYREVHQLPCVCMGACRDQYHTGPGNHRGPDTRAIETFDELEEEDPDHNDV